MAQAQDLIALFDAALKTSPDVLVDLQASEIDLSFVQILLSASVTAAQCGGELRLKQAPSGPLRDMLVRGGFLGHAECETDGMPSRWAGRHYA